MRIMAVGAHPDDIELSVAGLLARHCDQGDEVTMIDMTRGEMATKGTPEGRMEEAQKAAEVIGVKYRENLGLPDAQLEVNTETKTRLIEKIRKYRPEILIAPARSDRHPDHGVAYQICKYAFFLSGLKNWKAEGEAWRPKLLLSYAQERWIEPDVIIDISDFFQTKLDSLAAYASQFYDPNEKGEAKTLISTDDYWKGIEARARFLGRRIGAKYAEGLNVEDKVGMNDLHGLFMPKLS